MRKQHVMKIREGEELYWMDTKWGCGAIAVINGVVVDTCPIFKKSFTGKRLHDLFKMYRLKKIGG